MIEKCEVKNNGVYPHPHPQIIFILIGGKYFYTTNHSTLVAFIVGAKYKAGNGFKIIAGHTGM